MNEDPEPTPAEQRLSEHLRTLRETPPAPGTDLVVRVVRTVRWQRAVLVPLRFAAMIAGAVVDGLSGLLGRRGRSS